MTVPAVTGQFYPTKEDLINVYLRSLAADAARKGLTINVLPGSEYYMRAAASAAIALPAYANNKLGLKAVSPLDAVGDDLVELAAVFGIRARGATKASGYARVRMSANGTIIIPEGYQGTLEDGTQIVTVGVHTVTRSGTVVSPVYTGNEVAIETLTTGADVNQAAAAKFTWDSSSVGLLMRNALVDAGGLTGGFDADGEEVVRQRLLERLQFPGVGGNWSHVATLATNSSAAIQRTFAYPSIQGPGSMGIAIVSTEHDRTVTDTVVNNAASAVIAELAGRTKLNATTVTPDGIDAVIALKLPLPVSAGQQGGGWRDAEPWPNDTTSHVKITSQTAAGQIVTDATVLGVLAAGHHIAIWDDEDLELDEYDVTEAVLDAGVVKIKVNGGPSRNYSGAYISAGAVNIRSYADAALEAFLELGPGEKTSSAYVLPRALRQPTGDVIAPADLTTRPLTQIQSAHPEILSISWSARYATGTTTPQTSPTVPASSTDPPGILVLEQLAFRATTT